MGESQPKTAEQMFSIFCLFLQTQQYTKTSRGQIRQWNVGVLGLVSFNFNSLNRKIDGRN